MADDKDMARPADQALVSDQAAARLDPPGFDPSRNCNPIVGHKTWADGSHTPLYKDEADAIWASVEAERLKREADMPTEQDAIRAMFSAYKRLKELDWNEAIYCPKDGSSFEAIEAGSTGIHRCHYEGEWPNGHWWIAEAGDLYPARPILYRRTEAEKARWAALGARFRDSDGSPQGGDGTAPSRSDDSAGPTGIAKEPQP